MKILRLIFRSHFERMRNRNEKKWRIKEQDKRGRIGDEVEIYKYGSYLGVGRVYLLSLAVFKTFIFLSPLFLFPTSRLSLRDSLRCLNRESSGFLLFSRRAPLYTPDKASWRQPRCLIRPRYLVISEWTIDRRDNLGRDATKEGRAN